MHLLLFSLKNEKLKFEYTINNNNLILFAKKMDTLIKLYFFLSYTFLSRLIFFLRKYHLSELYNSNAYISTTIKNLPISAILIFVFKNIKKM